MRILIATGIYPPDIGGPAQYAANLERTWRAEGHKVAVLTYGLEKKMPIGIRHIYFFIKVLKSLYKADFCLALDTFSTGVPAMVACRILSIPFLLRVGGDFLWESYTNRTKEKILLSKFYDQKRNFSIKENIILYFTKKLFKSASAVVFNTRWQAEIFENPYRLEKEKVFVVENYYAPKQDGRAPYKKNYLWHVRETFLKNSDVVNEAFREAKENCPDVSLEKGVVPYEELMEKMNSAYAILLPSLSDVSPNYIIYALSFNKPCIMTADTGLRQKLDGLVIFVDPMDKNEIAEKICELARPEVYQEYLERLRRFKHTHTWDEIANEFMKIYSEVK